jgi:hypothetical protein
MKHFLKKVVTFFTCKVHTDTDTIEKVDETVFLISFLMHLTGFFFLTKKGTVRLDVWTIWDRDPFWPSVSV